MAATEIWRDLPEWEGLYQVSDQGRVRSYDREWVQPHSSAGTPVRITKKGKILKLSEEKTGYIRVTLRKPKFVRSRTVHQLILEGFVGPKPEGFVCRHLNGARSDNRIENLKWGTVDENVKDRDRHGKTRRGGNHYAARFTEDQVRRIRSQHKDEGIGISELSRMYSAPISTVNNVLNRKNWKHI